MSTMWFSIPGIIYSSLLRDTHKWCKLVNLRSKLARYLVYINALKVATLKNVLHGMTTYLNHINQ
jgi:hypothetical protein